MSIWKTLNNKKGFTLLELVIAMFILIVVLGIVNAIVLFSTDFLMDEDSQLVNQSNVRILYVQLEKDIRKFGVPEATVFNATDSCYTLGTSPSTIVYCYNATGNFVTRAGTVLATNIESFDVVKAAGSYSIDLNIVSDFDDRNQNNIIDVRLYLRK